MENIVVLSGAGISAESGISTFRDQNGLWENHSIEEVATPEGFARNPKLVLDFYNQRRRQLFEVSPNAAHLALAELELKYKVDVITQNVDDLHERAGSSNVLHLHGELKKVRSTADENYIVELEGWELMLGDCCPKGGQLRPHIVWFGEMVPAMIEAEQIVQQADYLIVVGTSLNVYPAAGLLYSAKPNCKKFLIDPNASKMDIPSSVKYYNEKASSGVQKLVKELIINY